MGIDCQLGGSGGRGGGCAIVGEAVGAVRNNGEFVDCVFVGVWWDEVTAF